MNNSTKKDTCEHEPEDIIYTSNPPQYRCKKCRVFYGFSPAKITRKPINFNEIDTLPAPHHTSPEKEYWKLGEKEPREFLFKEKEPSYLSHANSIDKKLHQIDRIKAAGGEIKEYSVSYIDSVVEEYKERFGDTDTYPYDLIPKADVLITRYQIQQFLREKLADQEKREFNDGYEQGRRAKTQDVVRIIKEAYQYEGWGDRKFAYNQALDDILLRITEE